MGRKKVQLELMADEFARRMTFNKRKANLLKKVSELSTLCGVDACLIIYDSDNSQPVVWPSLPGARQVLQKFNSFPKKKQRKNMMDQECYAKRFLFKLSKRLEKERRKNDKLLRTEQLLDSCLVAEYYFREVSNLKDTQELGCVLNKNIELISERIKLLHRGEILPNSQ
ncbi:agamous-like MADS-box protein AGL80 [Malania oleifera]|uniref:agamous-like MADS-box protein AGL80 n=1 Tax=Malania oleifera TaxID=397392 RepID=UPI0025AE33DC|nr:agamous-like MADS-box protein AGL80 [Malania oleifera]